MALAPVGAENLCHLGRCVLWAPSARSRVRYVNGRSRPRRACDDRRLMGLKLIFLIVSRVVSLLGLSRREAWWKDAEILMLRHQLAVAGRERPGARARLTWPDRALLALLAGALPIDRLAVMRLIVTPGTILRWHRDIVRRRWSRRSRQGRSGRPATHRKVRSVVLERTLVWNQRHLMIVLREYEDFYNTHRPHRALKQAAPLRQLPDGITDLDQFRVQRRDRAGGVIHEYRL